MRVKTAGSIRDIILEDKKHSYHIHAVPPHCVVFPIEYWARVLIRHVDRVALGFMTFTTKAL